MIDTSQRDARASLAFGVAAAVAAVLALILWWDRPRPESQAPSPLPPEQDSLWNVSGSVGIGR